MSVSLRKDSRKWHRWGAILIALPFLIVLLSGIFLQVKKEFSWIQPATQSGSSVGAELSFDKVLEIAKTIPELETSKWTDIDRLDVRPDDGVIKIRGTNGWEAQIDSHNGKILNVAKRRSDFIEAIHDGSWFHDQAKLWIFLPSAFVVLVLWLTGIYLFFYPYYAKRRNRKRMEKRKRQRRQRERKKENEMAEV